MAISSRRQRHDAADIEAGFYEHYKGGLYEVLYVASHTETGEQLVVYQSLRDHRIWVRPATMFFENVVLGGARYPRFTKLLQPSLISFAGISRQAA